MERTKKHQPLAAISSNLTTKLHFSGPHTPQTPDQVTKPGETFAPDAETVVLVMEELGDLEKEKTAMAEKRSAGKEEADRPLPDDSGTASDDESMTNIAKVLATGHVSDEIINEQRKSFSH